MSDIAIILKGIAPVVRELVTASVEAFTKRLEALEARPVVHGKDGAAGLPGMDGKDGASGRDGKDGAAGLPGMDGKDGLPGEVGQRGPAGDRGDKGEPGDRGEKGLDGAPGLMGLKGMDGLIGPEGKPGRDGRDGIMGLTGEKGMDGRHGSDGKDGQAGRDGFSPDDLDFTFDPETRNFTLQLKRDAVVVKEVTKPLAGLPLWRGTYTAGKTYEYGDLATWDGATWFARATTTDKPGDGKTAWKLCVMRGEKGEKGADGRPGKPGHDLTQLMPDGTKFR